MKWKLRIYCNDGQEDQYWEDGVGEYETFDKALIACYENSLQEVYSLMSTSDYYNWFETEMDFEVTDSYYAPNIVELGTVFPVATIYYDKAPWDRENDCDIRIVTGYYIVDAEANDEIRKYNSMLRETHGLDITVEIKSYIEDDGVTKFYYTTARYGDSDDAWDTARKAYEEADAYLHGVGKIW